MSDKKFSASYYEFWAKKSTWPIYHAAALLAGVDEDIADLGESQLIHDDRESVKKYIEYLELLRNDLENSYATHIYLNNAPPVYLVWAEERDILMPKALIDAVMKYAHLHKKKEPSAKKTAKTAYEPETKQKNINSVINQHRGKTANSPADELFCISNTLLEIADATDAAIKAPVEAIENAARKVEKASSRSWLGYQAYVYYDGFERPPAGAHFSQEWGFHRLQSRPTTTGTWREFDPQDVENFIYKLSGNPDLQNAKEASNKAVKIFNNLHFEVISILNTEISTPPDPLLKSLKSEIEKLVIHNEEDILHNLSPKGEVMSRDSLAFTQGYRVPPHVKILAEMYILQEPKIHCRELAEIAKKASSYLARKQHTSPQVRPEMERLIEDLRAENAALKASQDDKPSLSNATQPQPVERETLLWIVGVCLHKFKPSGFQAVDQGNPLAQHLIDHAKKHGIKPKVKNTLSKAIREVRIETLPLVEELLEEADMLISKMQNA